MDPIIAWINAYTGQQVTYWTTFDQLKWDPFDEAAAVHWASKQFNIDPKCYDQDLWFPMVKDFIDWVQVNKRSY